MELKGANFIGQRESALGGKTYRAVNPAISEEIEPPFREAEPAEIDQAAERAAHAAVDLTRQTSGQRAAFMLRAADEIEALGDALIERAMAETGLPQARLLGERARTVGQLRMFAEIVKEGSWLQARIDHAAPDRKPIPKPDLRMMLVPIGPVVVFGASNFPLAYSVAGGDTASAFAAGNPVVVKAHPAHPGTSELTARAVLRAVEACGMPDGLFSMVHGRSPEVSLRLVRHPSIKAVGFTGSLRAGRAIYDAAAARPTPIPVYAEMGSVNPVFLLPRALEQRAEQIAEGFAQSFTLGVGQFCTKPGLVFGLKGAALERFSAVVASAAAATPPGTMLHKGILDAFYEKTAALARVAGVSLVAEAKEQSSPQKTQAEAKVFTVDCKTFLREPALAQEVFGPATLVVQCESRQEMEAAARAFSGELTASFHSAPEDLKEFENLVALMRDRVGRLVFNGFPTGVEVCPSIDHGGPYPATTDARSTSVGTAAILRFARPVCYQGFPGEALPLELQDGNPLGIWRLVDGQWGR